MAFPTSVNSQITDAVTQANTKVIGEGPGLASGNFFVATSQALSNSAHNATAGQQQTFQTALATTVQGVSILLCVDTSSTGEATQKIFNADAGMPYA